MVKKIFQYWLVQQCQLIPGSCYAAVMTGPPETGPYDQILIWPDAQIDISPLKQIAQAALRSRQPVVKTRNNIKKETGEPLDALAAPLFVDGKLVGVFAVEMINRSQPMQQAAVQLVESGAKWLESMLWLHDSTAKEQLVNLIDLIATGLDNESYKTAVTEVANELVARFNCQRVSIGFLRFNRVRLEAISHSSKIDRQANLARALCDAMNECVDQAGTVVYPVGTEKTPQLTRMHAQLAKQLPHTVICTIPLVKNGAMIGALLLERSIEHPFSPETVEQCEQIGLLLGPVLEARKQNEQPLPLKVFDSFRNWLGKLFGPAHLPLKVVTGLSVALVIWLSLASATLRISSDSLLEAGICRAVVAPQQGYIAAANVRAGDLVTQGTLMAALDDRELRQEQRKWQSQCAQLLKEYRKALAGTDRAEISILNAKRAQAEAQLELVEQQLDRTALVAPVSGLVIKGDLSQVIGSPVERGEVLFEVAPTDEYRVVMNVDDRDIGLISPGQQGKLKLSGLPDQLIGITVDRLTPISTSETGRNFFRVEALMDKKSDLMRPGMVGIAKIDIGQEKLISIWTRRLVEWLRLFSWNYLP